jgi:hypothetical protein
MIGRYLWLRKGCRLEWLCVVATRFAVGLGGFAVFRGGIHGIFRKFRKRLVGRFLFL